MCFALDISRGFDMRCGARGIYSITKGSYIEFAVGKYIDKGRSQ